MTLSRDERSALLAATPLFAGIDASGLERIGDRVVEVGFASDQVIVRQGEVGTGFFLVATGGVRVIRDGQTLATLGPGAFFGELSVLDGRPRTAQVIATMPTLCLALASWEFEAVVNDQPSVALAVMRGLAGRLRDLTESDRH